VLEGRHVWISGRVQGVFFRDSCAREARRLGLAGWVRNLADGRVEAAFEGPADAVDLMVQWCGRGPPRAVVTGIEVRDKQPAGERGFYVR
jgi:acylphosphatase